MTRGLVAPARLALCLASTAAGLALMEAGARLYEQARGHVHYNVRAMHPQAKKLYRASYEYGYEPVAGVEGHNALGFKNDDYPLRKRPGVFRVMLAGDSLADTYGEEFRVKLQQALPGLTVELWNIGVNGYDLRQYTRRLVRKGIRYRPDLIVLFHCLNDMSVGVPVMLKRPEGFVFFNWMQDDDEGPQYFNLPGGRLLWNRSALYRIAALLYMDRRAARTGYRLLPTNEESALRDLREVKEASRRVEAPVFSVIFPLLMPESAYGRNATAHASYGRTNFPPVLRRAGIPFLDLGPEIPDRKRASLRVRPDDYIHMNPRLAAPYLGLIVQRLAAEGLIPRPGR